MRAAVLVSAVLFALPAAAAKRKPSKKIPQAPKAAAQRLTSPDGRHAIELPQGWRPPRKGQSVSPPGMAHLFFLTTPDDVVALDVAAGTMQMSPDQYFATVSNVRAAGEEHGDETTVALAERSSFKYFRSTERQGGRQQFFTQGVLAKAEGSYYATVTSPKRHPEANEWTAILGALASLRPEGTPATLSPARAPERGALRAEGPGAGRPAASAAKTPVIVDVGADGSTLRLEKPWELRPWGYTKRFSRPVHSFSRGALRCELGWLGRPKTGARELAVGLHDEYYKNEGRKPDSKKAVVEKKLSNGSAAYYYRIALPSRDDDPRKQWMLEAFLAHGKDVYYLLVAAARDDMKEPEFEKQSDEALDLVGRVEYPSR